MTASAGSARTSSERQGATDCHGGDGRRRAHDHDGLSFVLAGGVELAVQQPVLRATFLPAPGPGHVAKGRDVLIELGLDDIAA
jgi:hypothetical protein